MPIVNVKLLEGRTDDQLKDLVNEVTDAVENYWSKQRGHPRRNRRNEKEPLRRWWSKKIRSIKRKIPEMKAIYHRSYHLRDSIILSLIFLIILVLIIEKVLNCFYFFFINLKRTTIIISINILIRVLTGTVSDLTSLSPRIPKLNPVWKIAELGISVLTYPLKIPATFGSFATVLKFTNSCFKVCITCC